MMTVLPKTDLRTHFGAVRDQGQRPTCLAFAASDTHAALRGPWSPLSCDYAFFHAQRRSGRPLTDGAELPMMLATLREDGQPPEAVWPYHDSLPIELSEWIPPIGATPLFRRAGESTTATVDAIVNQLDQGIPVLVLLRLSRSFYLVGKGGVVDQTPGEQPDFHRRHAVIAAGHGIWKKQRAILVRNSWGAQWGLGGYAWLTEAFLQPRMFHLAVLKEDLSVSAHSAAA